MPRERELTIYIPVKLSVGYTRLARKAIREKGFSRVNILAKIEPGKYIIICRANNRDCFEIFMTLKDSKYLQSANVKISRYDKQYSESGHKTQYGESNYRISQYGELNYSAVRVVIAAHNDDVPIRLFIAAVNPSTIYSLGSCDGIRYKRCIPIWP